MATYAIGDIHGQADTLKSLINKLNLTSEDHVVFLGDYIDRGPNWFEVIKFINELKNTCKVTTLLGNHELMMINCLQILSQDNYASNNEYLDTIAHWMKNGGDVTLEGLRRLSDEDRHFALDFLQYLPIDIKVNIGEDQYILCHALPEDVGVKKYDSVWGRLKSYDKNDGVIYYESYIDTKALMANYANKIIVHGHTPVKLYGVDNKPLLYQIQDVKFIDIDLGCANIGKNPNANLCAFRLDDEKEFYAIAN